MREKQTSEHANVTTELRADLNALRQPVNKVAGDGAIIDLLSLRVGKPLN